jgi:hypothetical protein
MHRSKRSGWYFESTRHSLAAKGLSTYKTRRRSKLKSSIANRPWEFKEYWAKKKRHHGAGEGGYLAKRENEYIRGGRADGRPDADFDATQLRRGIKHEMEHNTHLDKMESKRYLASIDYDKAAKSIHWAFDDGRPKTEDFAESMRRAEVERMRLESMAELQKAEHAGNITFDNAQRFMADDFTHETKDFLNGTTDRQTYEANVKRKLHKHKSMHSTKASFFGETEHHKDRNAGGRLFSW